MDKGSKVLGARPHPGNPFICERKGLKNWLSLKSNRKESLCECNSLREPAPSQAVSRTWQHLPCGFGFRVGKDLGVKGLWSLPPQLSGIAQAKCVAGESPHGGPERPLSKAMKMKPGFCWKPQDVGGTKAVGCLPGRATYRERNQPESSQQNWKGRAI